MIYIIYKISIADQCYIGSTKDFKQRKAGHRDECEHTERSHHHYKVYEIIRANGGWKNELMIPIEEFECDSQLQARIREEYWRREYDAQMNSRKAYNTKQQYIIDNKDNKKEYDAQYREANKDKIEQNKKEYYEANKNKILQYTHKYHEANREKIAEKMSEKITCDCGSCITKWNESRHNKTKKHQEYLKNNVIINNE